MNVFFLTPFLGFLFILFYLLTQFSAFGALNTEQLKLLYHVPSFFQVSVFCTFWDAVNAGYRE